MFHKIEALIPYFHEHFIEKHKFKPTHKEHSINSCNELISFLYKSYKPIIKLTEADPEGGIICKILINYVEIKTTYLTSSIEIKTNKIQSCIEESILLGWHYRLFVSMVSKAQKYATSGQKYEQNGNASRKFSKEEYAERDNWLKAIYQKAVAQTPIKLLSNKSYMSNKIIKLAEKDNPNDYTIPKERTVSRIIFGK